MNWGGIFFGGLMVAVCLLVIVPLVWAFGGAVPPEKSSADRIGFLERLKLAAVAIPPYGIVLGVGMLFLSQHQEWLTLFHAPKANADPRVIEHIPGMVIAGSQIGVTTVVLLASLFVILSKRYPPKDKHWAYAAVGTIMGFWLKV